MSTTSNKATQAAQAARAARDQYAHERMLRMVEGERRVIGRMAPVLFFLTFIPWLVVDPGSSFIFWDTVAANWLGGLPALPDALYWGVIGFLSLAPPVGWFMLKKRWREFGKGLTVLVLLALTLWNIGVNFVGVQWAIQRASPGIAFSQQVILGIFVFVLIVSMGFEELWQMALFEMVGVEKSPKPKSGRRGFKPPAKTKQKGATP